MKLKELLEILWELDEAGMGERPVLLRARERDFEGKPVSIALRKIGTGMFIEEAVGFRPPVNDTFDNPDAERIQAILFE